MKREDMMSETQTTDFGPVIYAYTREQAIEDGVLVDVTGWASATEGFLGGFACPVAMTAKLWAAVSKPTANQDTRGRAHDCLWIASLAVRGALRRDQTSVDFAVLLRVGRTKKQILRAVLDGNGVTIGFREDEW